MNIRALRRVQTSARADADIARVTAVWESCRALHGGAEEGGDWLFGRFSVADAMYAPVVLRFRTYRIDVPPVAARYMAHVLADPALLEWMAAALEETAVIEADEAGTPA